MRVNFFGDFVVSDASSLLINDKLINIIKEADYNVVNFEAPITHRKQHASIKSGPSISQSIDASRWLIEHKFNVISLANNHIFDYGISGFKETKKCFFNVLTVGAGEWNEAFSPCILEKDGISVAVFAMAEMQFGILRDKSDKYGCAWINHPSVNQIVKDAKKKYDYVIIIAHAGLEGVDYPLPEWRNRYNELLSVGCDVIVGGHTHTSQGYSIRRNNKFIFYSLGNFCFQKNLSHCDSWNIGECISMSIDENGISFDVLGIKFNDNKLDLVNDDLWRHRMKMLNLVLANDNEYLKVINNMCLLQQSNYNNLFAMGGYIHVDRNFIKNILRYVMGKCRDVHVLNNLQCETHRWCMERILRIKNNI